MSEHTYGTIQRQNLEVEVVQSINFIYIYILFILFLNLCLSIPTCFILIYSGFSAALGRWGNPEGRQSSVV